MKNRLIQFAANSRVLLKRVIRRLRLRLSLLLMPTDLRANMHAAAESWWDARCDDEEFYTRLAYIRELELREYKPIHKHTQTP